MASTDQGGKPEVGKPEKTERPEAEKPIIDENLDKVTGGLNPQPLPPAEDRP
jgi:hypothetical protein